jgi:hypothetical protein
MSDLIDKILNLGDTSESSELKDYLENGVMEIIRDKRDPYFYVVSKKIKEYYLYSDVPISDQYKDTMSYKLTEMYWSMKDEFSKNFVKICMDYISECDTAMSKAGLIYLNELYKSSKTI